MPSFNNPKVTNPINSDVSEIRELLKIVAKQDYTGATDLPEGAKRLAAVSGGAQLQNFSNNSWSSIGKLMHDVDQLDGYHASTSATKGTIPVYNASAQLVGDLTGNAGTATKLASKNTIDIGGIATADATGFDGSGNITIPINSINVANENDNALIGIVSKAHGGTGNSQGIASDVYYTTGKKALDYGQIGYSKIITGVDIDSLVEPGDYISYGLSVENHWPYTNSNTIGRVKVSRVGTYITQVLFCGGETIWQRNSTNTGASWDSLQVSGGNRGSSLTIYISKSGTDNNTGVDNAHPVLTINRALKIADGWKPTQPDITVKLCLGEGDWGDVTFSSLPYTLSIYPYDGVAATSYSESLPKFGTLSFSGTVYALVRGVVADVLDANAGAFVDISNSVTRFGQLRSRYSSTIDVYNSTLEVVNTGSSLDAIRTYTGGRIVVGADSTCKVVENISVATAFLYMTSCSDILNLEAITFSVESGIQVTGKKYAISPGSSVYYTTKDFLDQIPGTVAGTLSNGVTVEGVPYGGGASDEALMADLSWKPVMLQSGGTLTGALSVEGQINLMSPNDDSSEIPSSNKYKALSFYDKNGFRYAVLETSLRTTGAKDIKMSFINNDDGKYASLQVGYKSDNTPYASAPTPPDSASGTEIVTAAWANKNIGNKLTNYLPLSGGTMKGEIKSSISEFVIRKTDNSGRIILNSGPKGFLDGASLYLTGQTRSDQTGQFILGACANSKTVSLTGKPDGSLSWNGKQIVRSINNKNADINGNVNITGIKVNNAANADSVTVAGYQPTYNDIANSESVGPYNISIRVPTWGSSWFVMGKYAVKGGINFNKSGSFTGIYSAGAYLLNENVYVDTTWPGLKWSTKAIVCIRLG